MAQTAEELRREAERIRREQELPQTLRGPSADDIRRMAESSRIAQVSRLEPGERTQTTGGVRTGLEDVTKAPAYVRLPLAAATGARRAWEGAAGTPGAVGNLLANVPGLGFLENEYGYEGAERAGQMLMGEQMRPSGRAESAVMLAGEFAGGVGPAAAGRQATVRGLPVLRNLAETAVEEIGPAVAGVAGQQALYGGDYQAVGETIGGVVGSLGPSVRRAIPEPGAAFIRNAVSGVTPEDFRTARELSERARQMGFPLSPDEVLKSRELRALASQVQGREQGRDLYRVRESRLDPEGHLGALAQADEGTFRRVMNQFLEQSLVQAPNRPIAAVAEAAESAANNIRARRTAAVTPYYEAARAPDQTVSESAVRDLISDIDTRISQYAEGAPQAEQLRELRRRLTVTDATGDEVGIQTNAGALDAAYQEFENRINMRTGDASSSIQLGARATLDPVRVLREITAENPNIAAGRRVYQRYSRRLVEPLLQGPLGILAQADPNRFKRTRDLMNQVLEGRDVSPSDFAPLVNRMSSVEGGREALEGLTRAYMDGIVEQSLGRTATGPRPNPSAFFSSQIDASKRQNLDALFTALDRADQRELGLSRPPNRRLAFRNLMSVLDATAGPGAANPPMLSESDILRQANASILTRLLQVTRPLATPASVISQEFSERRNRSLVQDAFDVVGRALSDTSPEGINRIERMARSGGRGGEAFRAANELLMVRSPYFENRLDEEDESDGNQ